MQRRLYAAWTNNPLISGTGSPCSMRSAKARNANASALAAAHFARRTIGHGARHDRHLGQPAAIRFLLDLDRQHRRPSQSTAQLRPCDANNITSAEEIDIPSGHLRANPRNPVDATRPGRE